MNDLKKRIDDELAEWNPDYVNTSVIAKVIKDCRAEIERLEARIAELEKPYVPMTRDELNIIIAKWQEDENWEHSKQRLSEAVQDAVIKRYNEQRSVK